ncbi:MAG: hypothetical protein ACRD1S_11950 [Vicinamibacterales bacterium]
MRSEDVHHQRQQSVLKPQRGQRQTACRRNISAPQRSHPPSLALRASFGEASLVPGAGFGGFGVRGLLRGRSLGSEL